MSIPELREYYLNGNCIIEINPITKNWSVYSFYLLPDHTVETDFPLFNGKFYRIYRFIYPSETPAYVLPMYPDTIPTNKFDIYSYFAFFNDQLWLMQKRIAQYLVAKDYNLRNKTSLIQNNNGILFTTNDQPTVIEMDNDGQTKIYITNASIRAKERLVDISTISSTHSGRLVETIRFEFNYGIVETDPIELDDSGNGFPMAFAAITKSATTLHVPLTDHISFAGMTSKGWYNTSTLEYVPTIIEFPKDKTINSMYMLFPLLIVKNVYNIKCGITAACMDGILHSYQFDPIIVGLMEEAFYEPSLILNNTIKLINYLSVEARQRQFTCCFDKSCGLQLNLIPKETFWNV